MTGDVKVSVNAFVIVALFLCLRVAVTLIFKIALLLLES